MRGIVLAGGSGTRLHPLTRALSKQLLPIYDKPMIYYPVSVLMLAGIREILIISTRVDMPAFKKLLGDGSHLGVSFSYAIQEEPRGIAEALIIGEDFASNDSLALVLGDNVFYGQGFTPMLEEASKIKDGAKIFCYKVKDAERFGVATFDEEKRVTSIEEKPPEPKSNYAITGLYFFDKNACDIARNVTPSDRGELEITSVLESYLQKKKLRTEILGRGFTWLDTGTHDSLLEASSFVQTIENRQGLKIACLEEISLNNGWVSKENIKKIGERMSKTSYGTYLMEIASSRK